MSTSQKIKQKAIDEAKRVARDMSMEVLGQKEKTPEPKKPEDRRSTMDILLGKKGPAPKQERVSPIVEAMLQTSDSDKKPAATSQAINQEIAHARAERTQREKQWSESQSTQMAKTVEEKAAAVALPSSTPKGPAAPKGKAQGIESFKRGKKN